MLCLWRKFRNAVFSPLRHEVFVLGGMGFSSPENGTNWAGSRAYLPEEGSTGPLAMYAMYV